MGTLVIVPEINVILPPRDKYSLFQVASLLTDLSTIGFQKANDLGFHPRRTLRSVSGQLLVPQFTISAKVHKTPSGTLIP